MWNESETYFSDRVATILQAVDRDEVGWITYDSMPVDVPLVTVKARSPWPWS